MSTFFWYDYETFGIDPSVAGIAQFAGLRTDLDLNIIGDPVMWYCKPNDDMIPDPMAVMVTGILPELCLNKGLNEPQFARHILAEMTQANTISIGFNSMKFDSIVTRFLNWRTLNPPYDHEYYQGCGRSDLLPLLRAVYAFEPDALKWVMHDNGEPSLKLTDMTAANQLVHHAAHDALSDVLATIALAQLIKHKVPKLFYHFMELRHKHKVQSMIMPQYQLTRSPLVHVSGMFGAAKGFTALVWPLAVHPYHKNEVIVWDQ